MIVERLRYTVRAILYFRAMAISKLHHFVQKQENLEIHAAESENIPSDVPFG